MTFKGPQSDIEFQVAHDGKEFGYEYTCYDCNLVTRNKAESMFNDGHCRLPNTLDAVIQAKKHQKDGDLIPNDLIAHFQNKIIRLSTFHQSATSPGRRKDGSPSAKRESAFFDQWLHEQESSLLTNLFQSAKLGDLVSHREATIAATLIQWLGTNVGFAFLESALKRCGYKIVKCEVTNG
jgi:hypothetical protein